MGIETLPRLSLSSLRPGAFRFFLAAVVLVCHTSRWDLGAWAVMTFFILSGYWIYRMWTQKYSRADHPVPVFLVSRFLRILPLFWLANALAALVSARLDPIFLDSASTRWATLPALFSNIFVLGYANIPHSQEAIDVAWTLDIELQFYLAFPLLYFLCSRPKLGRWWSAAVAAAFLVGLVMLEAPTVTGLRSLLGYGFLFLVGAAAAKYEWRPSGRLALGSCAVFVGAAAVCWAVPGWIQLYQNGLHGATPADTHHKQIFQVALALVTAPLALFTVRNPSGASDRHWGEATYVLYLFHWPVLVVHRFYFQHLPPLSRIPSVVIAWLVIAVVVAVVYRFYDQPIERLRRRWVDAHLPN